MRLLILGGDERNRYVKEMACRRGWNAQLCFFQGNSPPEEAASRVLLPYPKAEENGWLCAPQNTKKIRMEEVLKYISPGSRVWSEVPEKSPLAAQLKEKGCRILRPGEDEAFLEENAAITAEGALQAAMRENEGEALFWKKALVLGFGRIGRQLAFRLRGIGMKTRIFARRAESRAQARGMGFDAAGERQAQEALGEAEVIFSTIPELFLNAQKLAFITPGTHLYDLARGVDLSAALEMGISARRESGLPGRYAPKSAAQAMMNFMERTQGEEMYGS